MWKILISILCIISDNIINGDTYKRNSRVSVGAIFIGHETDLEAVFLTTITEINRRELKRFQIEPIVKKLKTDDSFIIEKLTCELIDEGVIAIFGPTSSETNGVVASICSHFGIPHFMFTWKAEETEEELSEQSMSLNVFPSARNLSLAYRDIIQNTGWKRFIVLYENDERLAKIRDILEVIKPEDEAITVRRLPDDQGELMKSLRKHHEPHIIIDCSPEKAVNLLRQAKKLNMSTEYFDYMFTDLDTHLVDFSEFQVEKYDSNISLVKLHTKLITEKIPNENINTISMLLHDAVKLFISSLGIKGPQEDIPFPLPTVTCHSGKYWSHGPYILNNIQDAATNDNYMTGPMQFNRYGQRTIFQLDVHNGNVNETYVAVSWENGTLIGTGNDTHVKSKTDQKIQNKLFRVAVRLGEPFLMEDESRSGNDRYYGYSADLIKALSERLHFKYVIEPAIDNKYGGYHEDTKKWDGIVAELLYRGADLGICDLTITRGRRSAVDFTVPFMALGISILFTKPTKEPPNLFSFLSPLAFEVWIYMATAYLGLSLLLYVIARISKDEWENPHPCNPMPEEVENIWSISNSTWLTMGSIMGQGCDLLPKSISVKLITSMWWFFALMMLNSYTANLAAFLTSSRMDDTINNIEDLANQNKIKVGVVEGGSTEVFFKTSNETAYRKIWAAIENAQPKTTTANNDEGKSRVISGKGLYAFLMESTMIEYMTERHCELTQVGQSFGDKFYGIALPLNSPYRTQISEEILRMSETGQMYKLKSKWWKQNNESAKCLTDADIDENELTIEQLGGVFLVLGVGVFASFLVGIVEFLWNVQRIAVEEKVNPYTAFKAELMFSLQFWIREKPVNTASASANASGSGSLHSRRSSRSKLCRISESRSIRTEIVQPSASSSLKKFKVQKSQENSEH